MRCGTNSPNLARDQELLSGTYTKLFIFNMLHRHPGPSYRAFAQTQTEARSAPKKFSEFVSHFSSLFRALDRGSEHEPPNLGTEKNHELTKHIQQRNYR